ncbi:MULTISPECIES: hypothetical protein [Clostridium]|uniref:Uncharacterized protein n=1 Tax=Clostridium frigoriphilum TaxID=443253 RepID=A0ABU7UNC4_9CLOT|nr:hypothetical protein [Clostridium sp. DSM 17811]MBU3101838.1 hypothetical protein [Clostridium sp. DSM 17811]
MQQTSDGGYIAAGYTKFGNKGTDDAILIKFNKSGATEWIKDVGGSDRDRLNSVQQTSDGGYIAAAYSASTDGDFTGVSNKGTGGAIIIKFNKSGTTEWIKNFSDSGFAGSEFCSVQQTSDGGYVAAGTSFSTGGYLVAGYEKMLLVKFNKGGTSEWFKSFGGAKCGDKFKSVQQTSDGGYVAVGDSTDGATLIKSDNTAITVDSTALRPTGVNASAVSKIDLVSTQLTNTGNNTATFKYKILNTAGINITQKIPASQIKAAASVNSSITLDPLTGTGTITFAASYDASKPISITLIDPASSITKTSTINN